MSTKKSRFDGIDTAAMTAHLKQTILGFKLANVYDGTATVTGDNSSSNNKAVYLFKLADPSSSNSIKTAAGMTSDVEITDGNDRSKRVMLLMESGVRFHPTVYYTSSTSTSAASAMPSSFAMKLRKHLRSLRLENVSQLGNLERVVDFRFGSGRESAHHVILELYGRGNIILTDGEYRILALLRNYEYEIHSIDEKNIGVVSENDNRRKESLSKEEVKVRVGNIYPVTFATSLSVPIDTVPDTITETCGDIGETKNVTGGSYEWVKSELQAVALKAVTLASKKTQNQNITRGGKFEGGKNQSYSSGKGKEKKTTENDFVVLKALLLKPASGFYQYGPSLIEHCLLAADLDPLLKLSHANIEDTLPETSWNDLIKSLLLEGLKVIQSLSLADSGGYILYKQNSPIVDSEENGKKNHEESTLRPTTLSDLNPHSDKILLEFQPHLLLQHKNQSAITCPTFASAVDEFFHHLSSQRLGQRAEAAEAAARTRLAKIQLDQHRRAEGLAAERDRWKHSAELVEIHAEDVDRALGVIVSALDTGMDWEALERLVTMEKENENPIALLVHELNLEKDQVILALPDVNDDWDEFDLERAPKLHNVTVSIKESAHVNAGIMFARYRASKDKEEKTLEASATALEAAEAKARKQLAEAQKKKELVRIMPSRKPHWFEKFHWFITSDNYLVVAGRDAQQNEQLVKRYLRPGDAYLHTEVHGSPTCILRAKRRRLADGKTRVIPLSDRALSEAGTFTICRSSAWSSKIITSAYWVESHQVSKTAPTGEYLTVGSFMIRGKKNFLPASSLEMGLGILFRLGDEASVHRHSNERRDFALIEQEEPIIYLDETSKEKESLVIEDVDEQEPDLISEKKISEVIELRKDDSSTGSGEVDQNSEGSQQEDKMFKTIQVVEGASDFAMETDANFSRRRAVPYKQEVKLELNSKKKQNEQARGKRTKNKRAKMKYVEQDDEDRELAMIALHGGESSKKGRKGKGSRQIVIESEIQQKAASETMTLLLRDSHQVAQTLDENVYNYLAECITVKGNNDVVEVRWNKFDAEVLEQLRDMEKLEEQLAVAHRLLELSKTARIDNYSASLAGVIRAIKKHGISYKDSEGVIAVGNQRKTKAEKQTEKEAWQGILAEDGILDSEGNDDFSPADDSGELAKLTGKPTPDDVILYAVPVCAPYQVLSQYKYRVKLTPGSLKRGKASKQCLEMFLHIENDKKNAIDDSSKRDIELIKRINEIELVQVIIGDVRINSAGASKVAKNQKRGAKTKNK